MNKYDILSSRELNMRCLHTGNDMELILTELEELEGKDFDVSKETFEKMLTLPYNKLGKRAKCLIPFYAVGIFDDGAIRRIMNVASYHKGAPDCKTMDEYIMLAENILTGYPSLQRELLTPCEDKQWDGFKDEPEANHLLNIAAAKGCKIQPSDFVVPSNLKFDEALSYIYHNCGYHVRVAIYKAACMFLQPTSKEDWTQKFAKLLRGEFPA